jgi:hypothetical protein
MLNFLIFKFRAYGGVKLDDYPTIKRVFENAIKLDACWESHPYRQPGNLLKV